MAELAARQAALVEALVLGGPDPHGFDADRLAVTRKALLRKRSGEAARHWPLLAAALGGRWGTFAASVLAGRPVVGGPRDGWDVARVARERGLLTDGALRELRDHERTHRYDGVTPPRPRLRTRLRRRFDSQH
jgi:hypothetical protein